VHVCVCACVHVRVCACVRVRVCACVRVCEPAHLDKSEMHHDAIATGDGLLDMKDMALPRHQGGGPSG
jgi:hypothetical protein